MGGNLFLFASRSAVSRNVQEEEDKESRHSCEFHSALAIATLRKCTTNGQVKTLDGRAKKRTLPVGHAIQSARASSPFVEIRTNPKLFLEFHWPSAFEMG